MKAVRIQRFGGPEVVVIEDVSVPAQARQNRPADPAIITSMMRNAGNLERSPRIDDNSQDGVTGADALIVG